jgi:hypothetical protein
VKQAQTVQAAREAEAAKLNFASHAAVHALPEHDRSFVPAPVNGHDLSQSSLRPAEPMVGRDYGKASCPVAPQRCPFGGACHSCPARVQKKPLVNRPGDEYEQEADRIADQMLAPDAAASTALSDQQVTEGPDLQTYLRSLQGSGEPLAASERTFFEPAFGRDFGDVRIHTGAQAGRAAGTAAARAFTFGTDVVFGVGEYAPDTRGGRRLLAHELAHVTQQTGSVSRQSPVIQRQAAPAPSEPAAAEPQVATPGLIVEDDATTFGPGQMRKTEFLTELRTAVCNAAESAMAGSGRTTRDCPYLERWFGYYGSRSPQHVERAIHKYLQQSLSVGSARDYIPVITSRVRESVSTWVRTGQITGLPEGIPSSPEAAAAGEGAGPAPAGSPVQRKARDGTGSNGRGLEGVRAQLGEGQALDSGVRSRMESVFGRSFSGVRVHTDASANALSDRADARAFTIGDHIAFASSEYRPGSLIGDAIIAHELAHVMQQGAGANGAAAAMTLGAGYDEFEADADQSAMAASVSLWGRSKHVLREVAGNLKPRLRSGLRLQACRRTVKQCPRGLRWAVVGQPAATGPVCVCAWRCLPPGVGYSTAGIAGESSGPSITCANRDRFGRCPGEPDYVTVDQDFELRQQGTIVGVGAHMSPLGGEAACGCLPLDIEGDPTGQQQVHAPLLPPGFDVTAIAGPLAEARARGPYRPPETTERRPRPAIVGPRNAGEETQRPPTPGTPAPLAAAKPSTPVTPPTPATPPAPPVPATGVTPPTAAADKGKQSTDQPAPGGATQPDVRPQPKNIQKDLAQNRPALDPKVQEQLQKDLDTYRANAGIRRVDEPGTPNVPVKGGTVAVARTTIPRLDSKPFGGASAEAIPENIKGKPGTSGGAVLKPVNPTAIDHAEQVALENLRVAIESELQAGRLTRADLVGRRVYLRVEQEPCSSCAAGIDNPDVGKGVIKQFSDLFPELVIEVRSARTSRSYVIRGEQSSPEGSGPASQ